MSESNLSDHVDPPGDERDGPLAKRGATKSPRKSVSSDSSGAFSRALQRSGVVWSVIILAGILMFTGWSLPKIGLSVMLAFASGAAGALAGFLFGVPKPGSRESVYLNASTPASVARGLGDGGGSTQAIVDRNTGDEIDDNAGRSGDGGNQRTDRLLKDSGSAEGTMNFIANSNLDQVSDWLTKIIVGVGLIQLGTIRSSLGSLGRSIGSAMGDQPGHPPLGAIYGLSLVIGTAVVAFLLEYIWTTTRLFHIYTSSKD
jgi:hypothetical protein